MTSADHARAQHSTTLGTVHRVGAILMGVILWIFGTLGFVNSLGFFETTGGEIAGLNSNGLLSAISLIVGTILIASGIRGGQTASTVTAGVGVAFILSGLANLAVLDTGINYLAFTIANVFFSLIVGVMLLTIGLYGRVSGGLTATNPYKQSREHRSDDDNDDERRRRDEIAEIAQAEQFVAEGVADPQQEQLVSQDRQRRAQDEHDRAWAHARKTGQAPAGSSEPG